MLLKTTLWLAALAKREEGGSNFWAKPEDSPHFPLFFASVASHNITFYQLRFEFVQYIIIDTISPRVFNPWRDVYIDNQCFTLLNILSIISIELLMIVQSRYCL
jgi:hypothetical protein